MTEEKFAAFSIIFLCLEYNIYCETSECPPLSQVKTTEKVFKKFIENS
jgi:hypothetical protein